MNDYSKDLAICEAATPGPWGFAEQSGLILAGGTLIGDARFLSDGEFIATFNPSHMIERIKREQAKDARIVELEALLNASQRDSEELGAHVERLRSALPRTQGDRLIAWGETPAQSLQAIKAEVEEEVIERCADAVDGYYSERSGEYAVDDVRDMPRKYS